MSQSGATGERIASGLGWFSLGLGLTQLAAPGALNALIGAPNTDTARTLQRVVGMRELSAGIGILTQQRPVGWVWGRVAGDLMDLTLLGSAFTSRGANRTRLMLATLNVLGITALDLYDAVQLGRATGSTAEDSGMHTSKTVTVGRPPEELYRFWRDFRNLERFMSHLESVRPTGETTSHWKAKAPAGSTVEWDADIVQDRANELIAWRSLPGSSVENSGVVRFRHAPGGRGTEVHVEMSYNPPSGALGSVVAMLFGKEPDQEVSEDLRVFKQIMETGEPIRSDASVHARPHSAQPPERPIPPETGRMVELMGRPRSSDDIPADAQTVVTATGGSR